MLWKRLGTEHYAALLTKTNNVLQSPFHVLTDTANKRFGLYNPVLKDLLVYGEVYSVPKNKERIKQMQFTFLEQQCDIA